MRLTKTLLISAVLLMSATGMHTPRSGFVTALEHFWNGWAAGKQNIMLIVCGSATSWISDKLLNNKGGLFDRTTDEIKLRPFTLGECEEYYQANNIVMSKFDQIHINLLCLLM